VQSRPSLACAGPDQIYLSTPGLFYETQLRLFSETIHTTSYGLFSEIILLCFLVISCS
jgi:hypothetical protein